MRDGAAFVLRLDAGGAYRLDLPRVPVDHVQKRVRITGVLEIGDLDTSAALRLDAALARLATCHGPTLARVLSWSSHPSGVSLVHEVPADSVTLAEIRAAAPLRAVANRAGETENRLPRRRFR